MLVHEWVHGLSSVKTNPGPLAPGQHAQQLLAGDGWYDANVWILVEDIAPDGSTASVQVWY